MVFRSKGNESADDWMRLFFVVVFPQGNSKEASDHLRRSQLIQENCLTSTTISSQQSYTSVSWMDDSTLEFVAQWFNFSVGGANEPQPGKNDGDTSPQTLWHFPTCLEI